MKNYTYTFSVAKPCAESWLHMTPAEKGNFCKNCQKEVIDFSSMKDEDIIHLIKNAKGSVCGRFRNTQLNRPMRLSYQNVQRPFPLKTILAGIVAITLLQPLATEASNTPVKQEINVVKTDSNSCEKLTQYVAGDSIVFKGRIFTTFDSLAVKNATIYVLGLPSETITDSTGRFTITLSDTLAANGFMMEVVREGLGKSYLNVSPATIASGQEQAFFIDEILYHTDGIVIMDLEEESPKDKSKRKNKR